MPGLRLGNGCGVPGGDAHVPVPEPALREGTRLGDMPREVVAFVGHDIPIGSTVNIRDGAGEVGEWVIVARKELPGGWDMTFRRVES